jgi:hypothetical protein
MKKILFLLLTVALFVNCDPKDVPEPKGKLDPNAMITIRPAKGVKLRSTITGLTALEVVEQAVNIKWQSNWFGNRYWEDAKDISRTFIEEHKDYEKPALLMWGTDIITQEGDFYKDFIYGYNVVITDNNNDTIAYIPDAVINTARPLIESAFADENYNEVYRLFNEAFTFIPIE